MMGELDNNNLDAFFEKIKSKFTPEYFEELSRNAYIEDRNYPENYSNWIGAILNPGDFKQVNTIANQIFTYEETECMRKSETLSEINKEELTKILAPTIEKMAPDRLYSIKNGCFSNKFTFSTSVANQNNLVEQLWKINYASALLDTGGYTELVVRELIDYNRETTPTIYDGMPLREEIRVFYNIDTECIEYMVDYWDYDYCRPNITNKTDQIIFDWFHNKISGRTENHQRCLTDIMNRISNMKMPIFDKQKINGIWSIDFMYIQETDEIYLIDMARAFRSAYWDVSRCKGGSKNEST